MFGKPGAPYMYEVTREFLNGRSFSKNSMSCSSSLLYSYGAIIAFWCKGEIVLNKGKYSSTTTFHQDVAGEVIGDRNNRAWTDGETLSAEHMLYQPKQHAKTIIDYDSISHYAAAAELLKNRSHTIYAKKLMSMSGIDVNEHNKGVLERQKISDFNDQIGEFIKGTKLKKTVHKLGERGTIGKIIGDKFYIFGLHDAGSLLKLKMAMSNYDYVTADLSTVGETREWRDGEMRITGVSKLGVKFNGKFMSFKQIDQMIERGDVSL